MATSATINEEVRIKEIVKLVGRRAENFYTAHNMCCSESIISVINQAFGSPLSAEHAVSLGSGFCGGMGGAGCTCGALNGAQAVLGLFLGPHAPQGFKRKKFDELSKLLHDRFQERFGATSCQILTEKVQNDRKAHKENCRTITGGGAELAAEIILEKLPGLAAEADMEFLRGHESKLTVLLQRFGGRRRQAPGGKP